MAGRRCWRSRRLYYVYTYPCSVYLSYPILSVKVRRPFKPGYERTDANRHAKGSNNPSREYIGIFSTSNKREHISWDKMTA